MNFEEYKKKVGLNVRQQLVGDKFRSSVYGRTRVCTEVTKKTHIVMHTTRTRATLQNEADNINNNPGIESFHAVVGKDGVIETVPVKYVAHHAGRPYWNRKAIGIELVELEIDSGIDNYMKYIGYLCYQEGIVPSAETLLWHTECGPSTKCAIKLKEDYGKDYLVKGIGKYYEIARGGQSTPTPKPKPQPTPQPEVEGNKVTVKESATHFDTGEKMDNWVKGYTFDVLQKGKGRTLIAKGNTAIGWVKNSDLVGNTAQPAPKPQPKPQPSKPKYKEVTAQVVNDVILGKYGNGAERKRRLEEAGYNYNEVQDAVNRSYGAKPQAKPKPKPKPQTGIKVGDSVTCTARKDIFGTSLDRHMFDGKKRYKVIQVGRNGNKNNILLDGVMTWVNKSTVKKA